MWQKKSAILQFGVDFWLIIRQLPKPIRALRGQEWFQTCGADTADPDDLFRSYGDTNIPCVENIVLIGALCFPVFLVVQFDTGIFYQVGVFVYGCLNGLLFLGLGQVVTWNDLVKQFEKGAAPCVSVSVACTPHFPTAAGQLQVATRSLLTNHLPTVI